MPKLGTAYVSIRAKNDKLKGDLNKAKGLATKTADAVVLEVGSILKGAVAYFGVTQLASFSSELTEVASNLQEVSSKYETVFRDQIAIADQWSEALIEDFSLSERESKQFLSSIQDLLVPMGMASGEAGKMSYAIAKLAVDLGSFNNQRTEDVISDIQSALVGNYETMKKYGVVLNEAAVKQEVFNSAVGITKAEITAADKAQAAYNIILKSSFAAVGDFQRTAGEHANTTKRLTSEWEDFAAALGGTVIDSITRIKGVTADILDNLTKAIVGPSLEEQIKAAQVQYEVLTNLEEHNARKMAERLNKFQERLEKFEKDQMNLYSGGSDKIDVSDQGLFGGAHRIDPHENQLEIDKKAAKELLDTLLEIKSNNDLFALDAEIIQAEKDTNAELKKLREQWSKEEAELNERLHQQEIADLMAYDAEIIQAEQQTNDALKDMRQKRAQEELELYEQLHQQEVADLMALDTEIIQAHQETIDALKDMNKENTELSDAMSNAFSGWANSFASDLNDMVWNADRSFEEILLSFTQMITQMLIQKAFIEPLVNSLGTSLGGLVSSGGSSTGGWSSTNDPYPSSKSAAPNPAILQMGGASGYVHPARSVGGGNMIVNIINNTESNVQTKERQGPHGVELDVVIDHIVAQKLGGTGTHSNRILRQLGGRTPLTQR